MTKYEELYGIPVEEFPNERENVEKKLELVKEQISTFILANKPYTYENRLELHELNQAQEWCKKILQDIEG